MQERHNVQYVVVGEDLWRTENQSKESLVAENRKNDVDGQRTLPHEVNVGQVELKSFGRDVFELFWRLLWLTWLDLNCDDCRII